MDNGIWQHFNIIYVSLVHDGVYLILDQSENDKQMMLKYCKK